MTGEHGKPAQEIIEIGKKTQFGQEDGADPAEAARKASPWSIRMSIRRFGLMDQETLEEAARDPNRSQFELIAIKKILVARKGNTTAMQQLEESVDGKLVEKKVEVKTDSYAALVAAAEAMDKADKDGSSGK